MSSTHIVSCERDGPSCAAWLLGESDQPPDHICPFVMAWSIRRFIEQRVCGDWQDTFDGFWPLPIGAQAIEEWHASAAPAERAATAWSVLWAIQANQTAFRTRPNPSAEIPLWYTPLVTKADAKAGLAAERHIDDAGSVWLLGLVEPEADTPNWWRWAQPVTLVEAQTSKAADLDTLNEKAKALLDWYSATLLGEAVSNVFDKVKVIHLA